MIEGGGLIAEPDVTSYRITLQNFLAPYLMGSEGKKSKPIPDWIFAVPDEARAQLDAIEVFGIDLETSRSTPPSLSSMAWSDFLADDGDIKLDAPSTAAGGPRQSPLPLPSSTRPASPAVAHPEADGDESSDGEMPIRPIVGHSRPGRPSTWGLRAVLASEEPEQPYRARTAVAQACPNASAAGGRSPPSEVQETPETDEEYLSEYELEQRRRSKVDAITRTASRSPKKESTSGHRKTDSAAGNAQPTIEASELDRQDPQLPASHRRMLLDGSEANCVRSTSHRRTSPPGTERKRLRRSVSPATSEINSLPRRLQAAAQEQPKQARAATPVTVESDKADHDAIVSLDFGQHRPSRLASRHSPSSDVEIKPYEGARSRIGASEGPLSIAPSEGPSKRRKLGGFKPDLSFEGGRSSRWLRHLVGLPRRESSMSAAMP